MQPQKNHEAVANSIDGVRKTLSEPAVCFYAPYHKDPNVEYVILWLYLKDDHARRHSITSILLTLLLSFQSTGLLNGFAGIDVVFAKRQNDGGTDRYARYVIMSEQLESAISALQNQPADNGSAIYQIHYRDLE
jgi:hypothetical protein